MPISMSKEHSNMRGRGFGLGPSPHFGQMEPESTSIIEEAKNLLSQFMKHSPHKTQESQNYDAGGGSEGCAISHNTFSSLEKKDSGSPIPRQTACASSENFTPERKPGKHNALAQQSTSKEVSNRPACRPERQLSTHPNPSMERLKTSHERTAALPRSGRRSSFSPKQTSKSDLENNQDRHNISRIRRSGRSKSGPTNYFQPICLSSEEESDHSQVPPSIPVSQCRAFDRDAKSPGHMHTIFSSQGLQIVKSRFKTMAELQDLEQARYSRELNPANYARRRIKGPETVLHIDFGEDEMKSVLELMSLHGLQCTANSELSLVDQITLALSGCTVPDEITRKLSRLYKLSHVLTSQGVHGDSTSILKLLQSPGKKELIHAKSLIAETLEQGEQSCGGQCDYRIEEIHRLAACLQCALKIDRRHHRDIDAFLKDAKNGCLPSIPCVVKAIASPTKLSPPDGRLPGSSQRFAQLLQSRELGCSVSRKINSDVASNFRPFKKWKGASNDVVAMAWSPDGTRFAAGATAQCDEHNMEYNRRNNLLLGDLTRNCLEEIPDHCIPRPAGGANRAVTDTRLFMSVTAVQWFQDFLFTGSYDNTVKLWDLAGGKASCYKTLRHDSKVLVMARSTFEPNVLATGTHEIGLWNVKESTYTSLELPQNVSKKGIELVPTSLAWGTVPSTKNILLAGLAESDDGIPQNGHLAAWRVEEGRASPLPSFSPNSQNIFDIKWHPTSEAFVTGSSTAQRNIGSVVRHYEPLKTRMGIYEFDCPALDINEVTFCPTNSNYVTASCTDGNTYVWDYRYNNDFVLKLPHGGPLNQTDETLTREQADVGVTVAFWGNEVDQFYTGASDGILKKWNILKSPEDALVDDIASLEEEITCATLSEDKSNLLVGDAAGGIHVLSSGPFFNTDERSFTFESAPQLAYEDYETEPESGVKAGRNLLASGQLSLHPVYGVGQGPHYTGPFAAWARPEGTTCENIARTQLRRELQIRQLDGTPIKYRSGLDEQSRRDVEAQIQLARIRNQRQNENKRKRDDSATTMNRTAFTHNFIDLCSDDDDHARSLTVPSGELKRRAKARRSEPLIVNMESVIIDLTGDTDSEEEALADAPPGMELGRVPDHFTFDRVDSLENERAEELEETLCEDFWWPPSHTIDPNIHDDAV